MALDTLIPHLIYCICTRMKLSPIQHDISSFEIEFEMSITVLASADTNRLSLGLDQIVHADLQSQATATIPIRICPTRRALGVKAIPGLGANISTSYVYLSYVTLVCLHAALRSPA